MILVKEPIIFPTGYLDSTTSSLLMLIPAGRTSCSRFATAATFFWEWGEILTCLTLDCYSDIRSTFPTAAQPKPSVHWYCDDLKGFEYKDILAWLVTTKYQRLRSKAFATTSQDMRSMTYELCKILCKIYQFATQSPIFPTQNIRSGSSRGPKNDPDLWSRPLIQTFQGSWSRPLERYNIGELMSSLVVVTFFLGFPFHGERAPHDVRSAAGA